MIDHSSVLKYIIGINIILNVKKQRTVLCTICEMSIKNWPYNKNLSEISYVSFFRLLKWKLIIFFRRLARQSIHNLFTTEKYYTINAWKVICPDMGRTYIYLFNYFIRFERRKKNKKKTLKYAESSDERCDIIFGLPS